MVLEGYLSRFLVERFGRYVKGLDAENLRLSAWKGEVCIRRGGLEVSRVFREYEGCWIPPALHVVGQY